jgi:hypothetical protein
MRPILTLSLLITLCGAANAATVHHAHRRHAIVRPNYVPPGPPTRYRAAPCTLYNEPYFGACQGYAPGEKQEFFRSLRRTL